jgi:methanogenic corrinoid protein MtbC1
MSGASIRVVANRTGIAADTLRVWERRYGFPNPERRPGGSRVYSEDDVARLLLVNRALAEGYRPSEVVPLPRSELEKIVGRAPASPPPAGAVGAVTVDAITDALVADDVDRVRSLLRAGALLHGPKAFVSEVAHPLAVRVGRLWEEGRLEVRHEHLASALLTTQLRLLLAANEEGSRRPVVVLATLPGEPHALALDMVAVHLAASFAAPRLLGADTPPGDIVEAAKALSADAVGLSISGAADVRAAQKGARAIARELPAGVELWLGGAGAAAAQVSGAAVRTIATWSELDRALMQLGGSRRRREG